MLNALGFFLVAMLPALSGGYFNISYVSSEEFVAMLTLFFWIPVLAMIAYELPAMKRPFMINIFVIGIMLIVMGQGVHMVANLFNDHLLKEANITGNIRDTAYFYDEHLGHYLWLIGYLIVTTILVLAELVNHSAQKSFMKLFVIIAAVANGLFLAIGAIESQTVPLMLPYAVIFIFSLLLYSKYDHIQLRKQYTTYYFTLVMLATLVFLAGWFIYYGGFPELTEVGLL